MCSLVVHSHFISFYFIFFVFCWVSSVACVGRKTYCSYGRAQRKTLWIQWTQIFGRMMLYNLLQRQSLVSLQLTLYPHCRDPWLLIFYFLSLIRSTFQYFPQRFVFFTRTFTRIHTHTQYTITQEFEAFLLRAIKFCFHCWSWFFLCCSSSSLRCIPFCTLCMWLSKKRKDKRSERERCTLFWW